MSRLAANHVDGDGVMRAALFAAAALPVCIALYVIPAGVQVLRRAR